MKKQYPLSIRDVSPGEGAIRLTGIRADGLPDGVHTGGAWLLSELVFKALEGLPYGNADCHVETDEVEALEVMSGEPLFPRNWTVEMHNNRRWLVRPKSMILGRDFTMDQLSDGKELCLSVEKAVRKFNGRGWEVNDCISLGCDPSGEFFIVDLSCAQHITGNVIRADDDHHIYRFFDNNGFERLHQWRYKAGEAHRRYLWEDFGKGYVTEDFHQRHVNSHIYASFARPLQRLWANRLPPGDLVHETLYPNWGHQIPHTWFFGSEDIDPQVVKDYELTWGWSPVEYEKVEA
jgi:hypothetical protein